MKTRRQRASDCGGSDAVKQTIFNAFHKEVLAAEKNEEAVHKRNEIVRHLHGIITREGT